MIELNHDAILGILGPICEQNQEAFSLASKVEVSVIHILFLFHSVEKATIVAQLFNFNSFAIHEVCI